MPIKKFEDAQILTADDVNTFFMDQVVAVFDTEVARTAAFSEDPLSPLPSRGSGGRISYLKSTGLIYVWTGTTWQASSQFTTPDLSITNAKVSTSASIALSKLAPGTSGQIIVANASGVPTYVSLSGDATISNTGVITVNGLDSVALGTETTGAYVATVTGTANQVTVSGSGSETAAVTLSLPQDINTTSSPEFANMTLTGSASVDGSLYVVENVVYNMAIESVANSASITAASSGKFIEASASVAGTVYVTGSGWDIGAQVTVMQMGTGSASISFPGQSLKGTPISGTTAVLRTQYSSVTLINRAENDWFVIGDLKV
jgi:hypothetical protein